MELAPGKHIVLRCACRPGPLSPSAVILFIISPIALEARSAVSTLRGARDEAPERRKGKARRGLKYACVVCSVLLVTVGVL